MHAERFTLNKEKTGLVLLGPNHPRAAFGQVLVHVVGERWQREKSRIML